MNRKILSIFCSSLILHYHQSLNGVSLVLKQIVLSDFKTSKKILPYVAEIAITAVMRVDKRVYCDQCLQVRTNN